MIFTKFSTVFRRMTAAALCLALCAGVCACGKEPSDSTEFTEIPLANEIPLTQEETYAGTVKNLTMPLLLRTDQLNPLTCRDEDMRNIQSLIYEPAIKISATGVISPSLIESWKFSESGRVMTLNVRKNVLFHDGSLMTADHILRGLNAVTSMTESQCEYSRYKDICLSAVKLDTYQIQVNCDRESTDVFYLLNFPVLSGDYQTAYTAPPVGTGAFQVDSYDPESGFMLVRNQNWWRTLPSIESINTLVVSSEQEKIEFFQQGEVNCLSTSLMTANSYQAEGKTTIYSAVTPYFDCLLPNCRRNFMGNTQVRKALSMALDRREVVTNGVLGEGISTETPLRPDLWYFSESVNSVNLYDTAGAKDILEDVGYTYVEETGELVHSGGDQVTLKFIYTESEEFSYRETVAETVSAQLADIGILAEPKKLTAKEYTEALKDGDFDIALASYYMNKNNDIAFMVDSSVYFAGFSGKDDLRMLNEVCQNTVDMDLLKESYLELESFLSENLPFIGLYYRDHALIMDSHVTQVGAVKYMDVFADINEWL